MLSIKEKIGTEEQRNGGTAKWRNSEMEEQRNGGTAKWRNSEMEEQRNGGTGKSY